MKLINRSFLKIKDSRHHNNLLILLNDNNYDEITLTIENFNSFGGYFELEFSENYKIIARLNDAENKCCIVKKSSICRHIKSINMFYTDLIDEEKKEAVKETNENEVKIYKVDELSAANHIVIAFNDKNYCHCIVNSVNIEKNIIEILYYDDGKIECGIFKGEACLRQAGVQKTDLFYDKDKFEIFKVNYKDENKCLSISQTLSKANELIGEEKYNVFENNDEHFAHYCKTGKAGKLFVIDPQDVNPNEVFGGNLAKKLTSNLAQQGTNVILVNTATHIATRFPRSAISAALPSVAEAAGSVIGIGIESALMGYDIHKKYKDKKEGKLSTLKFKKYIARRVTRGTFGVAGGIGGGIVGQMVIPVPVVGAMVGGFIGGLIGSAVGYGNGILIGELVEKVDTKVKEKKEKEKPTEKTKYEVLSKLVFKFDKITDIPEIEVKTPKINEECVETIKNKSINHDDYEIFVINNLNDKLVQETATDDHSIELDLDMYISINAENK